MTRRTLGFFAVLTLFLFSRVREVISQNWKTEKLNHHRQIQPLGARSNEDLEYFTTGLANERNFKTILDNILVVRPVGSPGHARVRNYIKDFMTELDWEVNEKTFTEQTPLGQKTFHNIIATLDPDAPRQLILACHYDSKITPKGFLGATDSAVPCTQIMNLAYTMRLNLADYKDKDHKLGLQFIFFDGEEAFRQWSASDSIYGAKNLAQTWERETVVFQNVPGKSLDRIDVLVLLDLIGASNTQFVNLKKPTKHWFSLLANIENRLARQGVFNRAYGNKFFIDQQIRAGIEDDHVPFEKRGVPILHLISYPFPRVWHTINDNKSAIDFPMVENLNKILRVFVAEYLQIR